MPAPGMDKIAQKNAALVEQAAAAAQRLQDQAMMLSKAVAWGRKQGNLPIQVSRHTENYLHNAQNIGVLDRHAKARGVAFSIASVKKKQKCIGTQYTAPSFLQLSPYPEGKHHERSTSMPKMQFRIDV